jgi:DNA polymerase III delta prime subunit
MNFNDDHFLFVEKYRPSTLDDVILPRKYKTIFKEMLDVGEIQHLLLCGSAGTGKTTIAKVLCNELNVDYIIINASENGNIDTLRTTIREFASAISISGKKKIVILDEADGLTGTTQTALRSFMEEFSKSTRFILTANFVNRIIEPLRSRCSVIEFSFDKSERMEVAVSFMKRLQQILQNESVEYDKNIMAELVKKYMPDMRKILNEIQNNIVDGKLISKVVSTLSNDDIKNLFEWMEEKEFRKLREWVALNGDVHFSELLRMLYSKIDEYLKPNSIPAAIMIMNEYDYKNSFVSDREINMIAFFTELMMEVEFK